MSDPFPDTMDAGDSLQRNGKQVKINTLGWMLSVSYDSDQIY